MYKKYIDVKHIQNIPVISLVMHVNFFRILFVCAIPDSMYSPNAIYYVHIYFLKYMYLHLMIISLAKSKTNSIFKISNPLNQKLKV